MGVARRDLQNAYLTRSREQKLTELEKFEIQPKIAPHKMIIYKRKNQKFLSKIWSKSEISQNFLTKVQKNRVFKKHIFKALAALEREIWQFYYFSKIFNFILSLTHQILEYEA